MSFPEICIIAGGVLTMFLAMFHVLFPRLFGWSNALQAVKANNARIFYTIHLALLLLFFAFTALSFLYFRELAVPGPRTLAFGLDAALAVFWLWRAVWQIAYFRLPAQRVPLKVLMINYPLTLIFILLFAAYTVPVIMALKC